MYTLQVVTNLSKESTEFCNRIFESKLYEDMFAYLSWKTLSAEFDQSESKSFFVSGLLMTLHLCGVA